MNEQSLAWLFLGGLPMDAWHGLVALVALIAILKLYEWCQMRYWDSPEYRKDWKPCELKREQKGSVAEADKERWDA
jgi:hypothetical protein